MFLKKYEEKRSSRLSAITWIQGNILLIKIYVVLVIYAGVTAKFVNQDKNK